MEHRLDRNGIPILDPPHQANKLPKVCHPRRHVMVRVGRTFVDQDWVMGVDYYAIEYRCQNCGLRDFEHEAVDTYGGRS